MIIATRIEHHMADGEAPDETVPQEQTSDTTILISENTESDCTNNRHSPTINADNPPSSGYYDTEKCRAHIANQIKVNRIDRFAVQVCKAAEVESGNESRLDNIMNMYKQISAQATREFAIKCKLGLQRHRQDRILNHRRRKSVDFRGKKIPNNIDFDKMRQSSISNDLFYGSGAQLIHNLLSQSVPSEKKQAIALLDLAENGRLSSVEGQRVGLSDTDYLLSELFEPELIVKSMKESIDTNRHKSIMIADKLTNLRRKFEKLASAHRDQVDVAYAIEEGRQTGSVIRRSAYNLSMAAIKATSTPVHVNPSN